MKDPVDIIVLLLAGASAMVGYYRYRSRRSKIINHGIEVEGIVFDFSEDIEFSSSNNEFDTTTRYPLIRFVTREGVWMTEKGDWASTTLKQGDKVTVIYNALDPKEFVYKASIDWGHLISYLVLIAGVVALAISLWSAVQYLINNE